MNVDRARVGGGGHADARGEQLSQTAAPAGAEDELGGVDRACELEQRGGDVSAEDMMVGAAEALHQRALAGQVHRIGASGQAIVAGDMDGEQFGALGAVRDAGGPADQGVALRPTGQRDHDPFPGLPCGGDVVLCPVLVELFVDLVGQPEQGELA
jgi:hypothetical protein